MSNIVSQRTLSVHKEHELLIKLEAAGLNNELAQIVIDSKSNKQARQIVEFLRNGSFVASESTQQTEFSTFLSGRIGIYKTLVAVEAAFKEKKCRISGWSSAIMTKPEFVLSQEERDIEWVAVSGGQLGFTKCYTRGALIDRAEKKFNLDRCQPEDGIYIRLGYLNQADRECIQLAVDLIIDPKHYLDIFRIGRDDNGLWLSAYYDDPRNRWHPTHVWLFRRRK